MTSTCGGFTSTYLYVCTSHDIVLVPVMKHSKLKNTTCILKQYKLLHMILFWSAWFYVILYSAVHVRLLIAFRVTKKTTQSFREGWEATCSWTACFLHSYAPSMLLQDHCCSSVYWAGVYGTGGSGATLWRGLCALAALVRLRTVPQQSGHAYRQRGFARCSPA